MKSGELVSCFSPDQAHYESEEDVASSLHAHIYGRKTIYFCWSLFIIVLKLPVK